MPILHKKFGIGNIRFINPKVDLLEIFFDSSGLRILSLKTCIGGEIIHALELKNFGINDIGYAYEGSNCFNNMDIKAIRDLALSIGETGDNKELLHELFKHSDYEVRRRACSAANKLKDKEITRFIVPCLYAKEPQIRQYALKAVLSSKCGAVIEHVKRISLEEDKDYNIQLCEAIITNRKT